MPLTVALCLTATIGATPQAQSAVSTGATIAGVVVAADSDRPIAWGLVVLTGQHSGHLVVSSTNHAGQFRFQGLPVDTYFVGASKAPYLGLVAGASAVGHPGVPISLSREGQVETIEIRLPKGAAISGLILDDQARPARSVRVSVSRRLIRDNDVHYVTAGADLSDDRGAYRIHGLAPGEYLVAAVPDPPRLPVYYPSTMHPASAQAVTLGAGDDRVAIDVQLVASASARIVGRVTAEASPGGIPGPVNLIAVFADGASLHPELARFRTREEGRFESPRLPPGKYVIHARASDGSLHGSIDIALGADDLTDVSLNLSPTLSIRAQVRGSRVPSGAVRIGLRPIRNDAAGTTMQPTEPVVGTPRDGHLQFDHVLPGRYVLEVTGDHSQAIEAVEADGINVTDRVLDVPASGAAPSLTVTLSDQWQNLSGLVHDPQRSMDAETLVLVFSRQEAHWFQGSRRLAAGRVAPNGFFSIGGRGALSLPAGDYHVAVVTGRQLDLEGLLRVDSLRSLISASTPVTLAQGEQRRLELRTQ